MRKERWWAHPVETAAREKENRHRNYIDTYYKKIPFDFMFSVVVSDALSVV